MRHDPRPRHTDGVASWTQLKGADPLRHYVLVNDSNGGFMDVDYYASMAEGLELDENRGYVVERKRPNGVRLRTGNTSRSNDDIIRFRGMVLMSCPVEFKKLLDDFGIDGSTGQSGADRNEKMVRGKKQRGIADDLSGIEHRNDDGDPVIFTLSENEIRE